MDFHKTLSSKTLQFSLFLLISMLSEWATVESWSYSYSNSTMNWDTARKWCRNHFTDMVAIQNHGEIKHLNSILPRVKGYYWIGIRKINNSWTWVGTNKKLTAEAENWAEGEPNNGRNNEDCVEIYIKRDKDEGKWNDESCKKSKTALCYTASCQTDSCSHHGECVETINSHRCDCFEGFYGEKCEHVVKCQAENIANPENGRVDCVHPNGEFSYKSQCRYTCDEGYQVAGSQTTQCNGSATWSSRPPTCEPVQCSELVKPLHATMQCDHPLGGFSYQSTCEFSCEKGYTLTSSISSKLTCEATGQWNDSKPTCEAVRCPTPEGPVNGRMVCSGDSPNYSSSCSFSCDDGFQLNGAPEMSCTESAQWSQEMPYCEAIRCPTLEGPVNGRMTCSGDSVSYGSSCSFSCDDGFYLKGEPEMSCTESAQWSQEMPYCEAVQCSELVEPLHATMQCDHPLGGFSYQSTCEFSCEKGYTLTSSSSSKLTCEATGQWNDSKPTCEAVRCPTPEGPVNGRMVCSGDSPNYSSSCSFSCDDGFQLNGAPEMSCTESAQWSQEMPYCEAIRCPTLEGPVNGRMTCSGDSVSYGSSCSFSCDDGFYLKGEPEMSCTESAQWSQEMPYCEAVQCSELVEPLHATMQCDHPLGGFSYQSTCEFSCEKGYTLTSSSSSKLTCEATGQWNDSKPTCEAVRCPTPEGPVNGRMACSEDSPSYSSSCSFSCDDGFYLKGAPEMSCTESAQWSQEMPYCEAVQCSELVEPLHATMQCDHPLGGFSYQSTCEFSCEKGYTLTSSISSKLTCEATGQWNDSKPTCEAVRCPTLESPVNGRMTCSGDSVSYGSSCSFSCDDGFYLKGEPEMSCTESAQWSQEMPYCEAVQCSELVEPLHATMQCDHPLGGFSYQSTCEFSCEKGYTLTSSSSSKLTCEATGQWNDSKPTCEAIRCPTPEGPANGRMVCSGDSPSYSSSCSFSCDDGFYLKGAPEMSCTESAQWSQEMPYCEAVTCPFLQEPENGLMTCSSEETVFGTTCSFSCFSGYHLYGDDVVKCNLNGNWSGEVAECQAHSEPLLSPPVVTGLTVAGAATAFSSFALAFWILRKLKQKAEKFDVSNSDIDVPPQVYKSIDSLI
ncbi:E-selectin [Salminus brasiliensis]|uniref:E-selectin n=1 Tax=Salminus brasiliensis TaxID=930266 RepID=UPI003B834FDC